MHDARIFIPSLDDAKRILQKKNTVFKGEYTIHDTIYASNDPNEPLEKVYLRLRHIPQNIWEEKAVIVSVKITEMMGIGKQSHIPTKKEFDTIEKARAYIAETFADNFTYSFDFNRIGWQYFIEEDGVDLEIIEGHPSIEFKSPTEEGLQKLLTLFGVTNDQIVQGPAIIAVRQLL